MKRCVDSQNHVVDPALCNAGTNNNGPVPGSGYHFYYGGGGSYTNGSIATGGSTSPACGVSYSTPSGTSRGGCGSSFSGSGGGGEGGGGGE